MKRAPDPLGDIARLIDSLSYDDLVELTDGIWSAYPDLEMSEENLPSILRMWALAIGQNRHATLKRLRDEVRSRQELIEAQHDCMNKDSRTIELLRVVCEVAASRLRDPGRGSTYWHFEIATLLETVAREKDE